MVPSHAVQRNTPVVAEAARKRVMAYRRAVVKEVPDFAPMLRPTCRTATKPRTRKSMAALAPTTHRPQAREAKPAGTYSWDIPAAVFAVPARSMKAKAPMEPTATTVKTVAQGVPATMDKVSLQITAYGPVKPEETAKVAHLAAAEAVAAPVEAST